MNIGHHCRKWKSPILGVERIVLRDIFLASIFLAYDTAWNRNFFFRFRARQMVISTIRIRTQFVLQHKIQSFRNCTVCTYVGKRLATKQRTAPWEMSTKSTSVRKKIPLSPQVHTADIPRGMRAHMDKSVFFS